MLNYKSVFIELSENLSWMIQGGLKKIITIVLYIRNIFMFLKSVDISSSTLSEKW